MPGNPSRVVLDTSVSSLLFRNSDEAEYYKCEIEGMQAVISFQTLEESWYGAFKGGWGAGRMNKLRFHLDQFEVIWPNREMAEISANLRKEREKSGSRLNTADAWIAATAIMLDCSLASKDGDFKGISNLQLIQYSPNALSQPPLEGLDHLMKEENRLGTEPKKVQVWRNHVGN